MAESGWWIGSAARLSKLVEEDKVVAKRGKPGMPRVRFLEGLGPEDPKFDVGNNNEPSSRAA